MGWVLFFLLGEWPVAGMDAGIGVVHDEVRVIVRFMDVCWVCREGIRKEESGSDCCCCCWLSCS
jgi:hypothetical protein